MTAQTEKPDGWSTANQLDITQEEHDALFKVYQILLAAPDEVEASTINAGDNKFVFNMNHECTQHFFGTAMCIGGHVKHLMLNYAADKLILTKEYRSTIAHYVHDGRSNPLHALYFPDDIDISWDDITPRMAAEAIDNFMRYNDPRWNTIEGTMKSDEDDNENLDITLEDEEDDIDA